MDFLSVVQTAARLVILPLLLWIGYHWWFGRILTSARKLPTAFPTLPVYVHFILYGVKRMTEECVMAGQRITHKLGTFCIWFGPYPVFVIRKAEDIQVVLSSSKTEKGSEYDFLNFALGNGLLIAKDHVQKITRRHINPLFQPRNVEQLMPAFNRLSRHLARDLSEHVDQGHVDISETVNTFSLTNIAGLIFGHNIKIDTKSEDFRGITRIGNGIARIMRNRIMKLWLWPNILFNYLWRKEIDEINCNWRKFSFKALKLQDKTVTDSEKTDDSGEDVVFDLGDKTILTLQDTYDVLQKLHPQFTDQDLHHEMITLLMAGTDTTQIALCSCLLSLAALPSIQDRVYQEIMSIVGQDEVNVAVKHIQSMPYLDQVFKETLRKFTIIPLLIRKVKQDITLSDCELPVGATVWVSLIGLHHDPDVFPDPHTFDPDRFAPRNESNLKKSSFLPFSLGSRNCIGSQYATLLVKTAVIHVVRRFRLTTTQDINRLKYKFGIAMIADKGYRLQLRRRGLAD